MSSAHSSTNRARKDLLGVGFKLVFLQGAVEP